MEYSQMNRKTRIRNLVLSFTLIFSVGFTSCATYVYVDEKTSPEISLKEGGNKMVVQNFFNYNNPDLKEKHHEVYKSGVESFANALHTYLLEDQHMSTTLGNLSADSLLFSGPFNDFSKEFIAETCQKYQVNYMLSIDSMAIYFDSYVETVEEDGEKSKTKYFSINVKPFLSLYNIDGALVNHCSLPVEKDYKARPTLGSLITFNPSMEKAQKVVEELAAKAGRMYGDKFFDGTKAVPYKVFLGGMLTPSVQKMYVNQYTEAIEILQYNYDIAKPKQAKKIAHNLSVCYTALGDEKNAGIWKQKAGE